MSPVKRKLCIVTPEFPPDQWGGLARTVERVAFHARDAGLDVHVAHFTVVDTGIIPLDENNIREKRDDITIHHLSLARDRMVSPQRSLWDCPHNLTLQMMYQSLELLHDYEGFSFFQSFFLYPVGYITGLMSKRYHLPNVVTIVGNDVNKYFFSPEKVALCRSGLENADIVIGMSKDLVALANALFPVHCKARIIYNSVDLPLERWKRGLSRHQFTIGCAGIFKYAKGLPYLFKAVSMIKNHSDIQVELVGEIRDSEEESLNFMLERTGVRNAIKMRGALPHSSLLEWLTTLDVFVLPSVTEGCPNVLMEAMASGVPVIATRTGATDDLIEDGVSGIVVPRADSAALARGIVAMMKDPAKACNMGRKAREKMKEFSRARELSDWSKVYEELLNK